MKAMRELHWKLRNYLEHCWYLDVTLTALGRAGATQKVREPRKAQRKPSNVDGSVQSPLEEPVTHTQQWSTNYSQTQTAGTPQINELWSLSFTEGAASTQRNSQQVQKCNMQEVPKHS